MRTLEGLHPCVLAHVASELIRASKLPVAPLPVALVRLFPSVGSLVCLEVGTLGVDFAASWVSAPVDTLVPLWLGIVVHGIHQPIGPILGGHTTSQHLGELLDWRGWAGSGGADRVVVERCGGKNCLRSGVVVLHSDGSACNRVRR